MRFVPIMKARKPRRGRGGEEWRAIHAAADGTSPSFMVAFINASRQIGDEVTQQAVESLIGAGALDRVVDNEIDWMHMETLLRKGVKPEMIRSIKAAADAANKFTASTIKEALGFVPELTFNPTNARVSRWIDDHTAEFVTGITEESRNAIKAVVGRSMVEEMSASEIFRTVRQSVGLTERMAVAAQNIFHNGVLQGLDRDEAMLEASNYADRALTYRAEMIARTESLRAANAGQSEGWLQAADQGYFNRNEAEVEWVVTPDDRLCEYCQPMDGVTRPVNGTWQVQTPTGSADLDNPTDIHPQCRCAQRLILPGM